MDERINIYSQIRGVLDDRFNCLRKLLTIWMKDMEYLKRHVTSAFDQNDMEQIQQLMNQYHMLRRRIEHVQQFIINWEHNQSSIMNDD